MDTLIIPLDDGGPGISVPTANGFVARCVSAIAAENIPDAILAAEILNAAAQARPVGTSTATATQPLEA